MKIRKIKLYLVFYSIVFILLSQKINTSSAIPDCTNTRIAFLTDINLYPTPTENIRTKSKIETEKGILVFESQAILLDLIKLLNEKIKPDITVFGGNNISNPEEVNSNLNNQIFQPNEILQLFIDMISELRTPYFINNGNNEKNSDELNRINKTNGAISYKSIWTYLIEKNNVLLIGLNDNYFLNEQLTNKELNKLSIILKENKNRRVILITHKPVLYKNRKFENLYGINKLYSIIKDNKNIKVIISGDSITNSSVSTNELLFISSTSPTQYPCTFMTIDIKGNKIQVRTHSLPLRGIIKKAKEYLKTSKLASVIQVKEMLKNNQKEDLEFYIK